MKKILLIIILLISLSSCSNENVKDIKNNQLTKEQYETNYIETIPNNANYFIEQLENNEIILNEKEIETYNQEIITKSNTLYNLNEITNLTKQQIKDYISYYQIPSLPKYNGNKKITTNNLEEILENRNINNINDLNTIPKGVVVNRTNLKSFPTHIHFYNNQNDNIDNIQETELHINTEVLIIHESLDQSWYFVISNTYIGWVLKNDIAIARNEDIEYFINNQQFGIITEPIIEINNTILDMSVKLPHTKTTKQGYHLILPVKGEDNYVEKKEIIISRDKAHIGYLPYTKRNVYIQAFKYENYNYGWGGSDNGVDCSSYISNIYKTFGFIFPRNTSSQKENLKNIVYIKNKTPKEKLTILSEYPESLIYQPGHVMLYLGTKENKHYIIHASGKTFKITYEELTENSNYLKNIDRIISISK